MATTALQFPSDAPSLGDGRYVLVSRLGSGAVGAVYRGYDRERRAWRAIKVLLPQAASLDWVREQFESDARTLGQLEHPHLVRIHDVGDAGGLPYVVMELVTGASLLGWIETHGALPAREACEAVLQVVYGLCAIHELGVVHGAVNPRNVLVAPNGSAKLGDFGIAAPPEGSGHAAPEQIDGQPLDARADLYGAGATLWHLLRGQDPAGRADLGGIDRDLHAIIRKCTAPDREDRWPSAPDLALALEAVVEGLRYGPPETPDLCIDRPEGEDVVAGIGARAAWIEEIAPLLDDPRDADREFGPARVDSRSPSPPTAPPPPLRGAGPAVVSTPSLPPEAWSTPEPHPLPSESRPVSARRDPPSAPPASLSQTGRRPASRPPVTAPPPAPLAEAESEEAPSRIVNWVLMPLGGLVAGVVLVLLVMAVIGGIGLASLSGAADATAESQISLYRLLNDERRLVDELASLGADRSVLEQVWVTYLEETTEPARLQAALAVTDAVDGQAKGRIEEVSAGTEQADVARRVRQVLDARHAYDASLAGWRDAAQGPLGQVVLAVGVGPAPP